MPEGQVKALVVVQMWNIVQGDAGSKDSFMGNGCLLQEKTKQKIKTKVVKRGNQARAENCSMCP